MMSDTNNNANSSWPYQNETNQQRDARMQWWRDARFGLFIHWGVYSVPAGTYKGEKIKNGGEWILYNGKIPLAEYTQYAKKFNPVKYDPQAWVLLAKEAGMKYIVITAKHHDGLALFDSAASDWNVVKATSYGKDLLEPLAQACQKHDIKLGFYYSQAQDWFHPGGARWLDIDAWDSAQEGDMTEYVRNVAAPQVKELLTKYGEISILWWDTPTAMTQERTDLIQPLINLQPGLITNDRIGNGYPGDFITPEQHVPAKGFDYDWEACMTMNKSWGFKSYDDQWKSEEELLINLIDIVSKGGNYLLNVGPNASGEIPAPSVERLKAIGRWLKVNGQSIYGTTATPIEKLNWGRCTKVEYVNGANLYLHVFNWPQDGKLIVPGLKNKVAQAYLLGDMQRCLQTTQCDDGVLITVDDKPLDEIATVIVLKVEGQLEIEEVLPRQNENGDVVLKAQDADIHNVIGKFDVLDTIQEEVVVGTLKQPLCSWADPRVCVDWSFEITQMGRFEIIADLALEAEKSKFDISVAEQNQKVVFNSTGAFNKIKSVKLGQTAMLNTGIHNLKISPDKDAWETLNFRSITLQPLPD